MFVYFERKFEGHLFPNYVDVLFSPYEQNRLLHVVTSEDKR